MYFRTREGLETPDATISILPFLYEMVGRQRRVAKRQGITMNANVLRSESTGSVHIKSADAGEPPAIRFNFLSTEHDRAGILRGDPQGARTDGDDAAAGDHRRGDRARRASLQSDD